MDDSTPQRKSGRQPVPNRKYANEDIEILNKILASDSEDDLALIQHFQEGLSSDEEFPEDQITVEADDDDDDDESLADDVSDGSGIKTPVEVYEDAHSYASSDPGELPILERRTNTHKDKKAHRDPNVHSRGMQELPIKKDCHRSRVNLFAGDDPEGMLHIAKSRDQWANDPTLPGRSRLCHLFSHTQEKRQMEAMVGWDWYYNEGGREEFAKRQKTTELSESEAKDYSSGADSGSQAVLMGSCGGQNAFDIAPFQSMKLRNASNNESMSQNEHQSGWMLNAGSRARCICFAPNHADTQYLAIATADAQSQRQATAFSTSMGPASIHIWAIAAHPGVNGSQEPELRMVLCFRWGQIKQLKWCPVPRMGREGDATVCVGLLASIWSDGFARVIDVQISQKGGLQFTKVENASFAARISGSLATCLTWLSATDLAVGHANGQLTIYNICKKSNSGASSPRNPTSPEAADPQPAPAIALLEHTPWLSMVLHPSYILDITSAYPSHPALLMSTSAAGNLRLTSLLAPKTDFVLSLRTRAPPSAIAYHDGLLSVVGMEESSETLRLWPLRCFYTSVAVGKLSGPPGPGNGVTDVGKSHATIAAGGADGSVMVTNPLRKILGRREPGYQQCIFKHEWVRLTDTEGERRGISRITEGYKAEEVFIGPKNRSGPVRELVATTTIYEEETAVTALAWNPNVSCGGWLAVGWGSGLVRIQDVAI